jgi:hypothetical protein
MNEGTWPAAAPVDPWLNRRLREAVGLPLPERRIGQAALDYQLALAAPEVWITRAQRTDEAPTVPSRWLNRLLNLLEGLPDQGGDKAVEAMRERGDRWLAQAAALSRPDWKAEPARRPSPRPPLAARPRRISVTALERLRRDPYSVYADTVLRLPALDPLTARPDAPLRGTAMHKALERFLRAEVPPHAPEAQDRLLATASDVFDADCAWPVMRRLWLAQLARIAPWFLEGEAGRRATATPAHFEIKGEIEIPGLGITLVAKADRIDLTAAGRAVISTTRPARCPATSSNGSSPSSSWSWRPWPRRAPSPLWAPWRSRTRPSSGWAPSPPWSRRRCPTSRPGRSGRAAGPPARLDGPRARLHLAHGGRERRRGERYDNLARSANGTTRPGDALDCPDGLRHMQDFAHGPRDAARSSARARPPPAPPPHDRPPHLPRRPSGGRAAAPGADPRASTWLSANAGSGKTRVLTDRWRGSSSPR